MPIASLHHITHQFSGKQVLSELSLDIKANSITALLGKSGSGKSTILNMINGMIRPDSGTVHVFDHNFDYEKASSIRLKIGYAVQQTGLFPHLTIADNIALLGKVTGKSASFMKERTSFLMDIMQLSSQLLPSYPHQLSGGEQQRAGLCRAFFLQPPLVLMDEPFAPLDYKTKQGIYQYLLDFQQQERTSIVLVTHQFEEAVLLSDEFVWINEGQIYHQGDTTALKKLERNFKEEKS